MHEIRGFPTYLSKKDLGLLIPLLMQLADGTYHRRVSHRRRTRNPTPRTTTGHRQCYSADNLYLVYMALFDLVTHSVVLAQYGIILFGGTFHPGFNTGLEKFPPNVENFPMGMVVQLAYTVANVWINGFILHRVLILLRTSRRTRRMERLSLRRVNGESFTALMIAVAFGFGVYHHLAAARPGTRCGPV